MAAATNTKKTPRRARTLPGLENGEELDQRHRRLCKRRITQPFVAKLARK
jgi:hypothetical protein